MTELDPKGLRVARRYAGWMIGDREWADRILDAYLHPDEMAEYLDEEEK